MATKSARDTKKVLTNIDSTLQELREGVQPEKIALHIQNKRSSLILHQYTEMKDDFMKELKNIS